MLVGFGLALLRKTLQDGPQVFDLFNPKSISTNLMNIMVIMVALSVLVVTFLFGVFNKYKFNKILAKILGVMYIAFVVAATIIAVKAAMA